MLATFRVTLTDTSRSPAGMTELERLWIDLQGRSAHSFYTSWNWIGSWLRSLPVEIIPQLLKIETEGRVVGAALLGRRRLVRGKMISSRGLFLQETGDPACDGIFIEHNGLLAERSFEQRVWRAVLDQLVERTSNWDEFFLSGMDDTDPLCNVIGDGWSAENTRWKAERETPCHYVDLDAIRVAGRDYLTALSGNTRSQIRRAMKLYSEPDGDNPGGPLSLAEPHDLPQALQFFDEMKAAHTTYWQRQGEPGSFTTPFSDRMHRALIKAAYPEGGIQLLRINAGERPIGWLYNFVHDGRVMSYQSGFDYSDNPKLKPGLVSHALAVQHNLERGLKIYDFLAGDSQYKRMLSNASTGMRWLVLRRDRVKFRVEELLRSVKQFCMK